MKFKLLGIGLLLVCSVAVASKLLPNSNTTTGITERIKISADYPKYDSLDTLIDRADTVIMGKILNVTYSELNVSEEPQSDDELLNPSGEIDNSTFVYTIFDIEVKNTYKGNVVKDEIIQVKQPGGIIGNIEYVLEEEIDSGLQKDDDYIFFLETYTNSPASLLNPIQGSYEVEPITPIGREKGSSEYNYNVKSNENNDINFTMKDLVNNVKLKDSN